MIYQYTWPAIFSGDKIESTRLLSAGSQVVLRPYTSQIQALYVNGRKQIEVGGRYAVQPARGAFALYWKPSPARDGRAIIFSSTGKLIPVGGGWRRAEIEIKSINIVTLGELMRPDDLSDLSELNLYYEGYLALGGNHGGPQNWFKSVWETMHGPLNKSLEVVRYRFDLVGREVLCGLKNENAVELQRLAAMGRPSGLLLSATGG